MALNVAQRESWGNAEQAIGRRLDGRAPHALPPGREP
jgi:hypothetical protein